MTTPVALLLASCCPATIRRFVVAVDIDAIEAHAFRSFPHVSKEVVESLPSFANYNPSTAVVFEAVGIGIVTTIFHGVPTFPRRTEGQAMSSVLFCYSFSSPAAAGFDASFLNIGSCDAECVSTATLAEPVDSAGSIPRTIAAQNCQEIEGVPSQVDKPHGDTP